MGMTDYGADMIAEAFVGITATPRLYLALAYVEPDEDSDGDDLEEPTDVAYARQPIYMGAAYWTGAYSGVCTYQSSVTFPTSTEEWDSIPYWVLTTTISGGEIVLWGVFDDAYEIAANERITIPSNAFGISVSAEEDAVMT